MNNKDYLTIKDFAEAAGVTQQSIYRRLNDVLSPYVIMLNSRKVLKKQALEVYQKYLEEHGVNTCINNDINMLKRENTELNEQIYQLKHDILKLEHENTLIKQKAELLSEQTKQLQEMNSTLTAEQTVKNNQISELQTALKAAQTIQALQLKQIEDRQREEPEQKQGFFARLFKKS